MAITLYKFGDFIHLTDPYLPSSRSSSLLPRRPKAEQRGSVTRQRRWSRRDVAPQPGSAARLRRPSCLRLPPARSAQRCDSWRLECFFICASGHQILMFHGISQVEAEVPPPTSALGKEDPVNVEEPAPAPVDDAVVSKMTSPDDALAVVMEGDAPPELPSRGMMFVRATLFCLALSFELSICSFMPPFLAPLVSWFVFLQKNIFSFGLSFELSILCGYLIDHVDCSLQLDLLVEQINKEPPSAVEWCKLISLFSQVVRIVSFFSLIILII